MKMKMVLAITISLIVYSCGNSNSTHTSAAQGKTQIEYGFKANHLEVYCFHGTRQCVTCKNMKAFTLKALQLSFESQLKDSTIIFQIVDVDDEKNSAIAEKFEATGTALMFNKVVNGKDSIFDLSDFAFEKADDESKYIPQFTEIVKSLTKTMK